jgi:DNA-binding CsgD family transcriptional regulator
LEILTYRLAGYRNGEIAAALGLSSHKDVSLRMAKLRQLAGRLIDKKESPK